MAKKPSPPIAGLEAHLGFWLRYVSNHVSQAFARRVEAEGVTVAEWAALRTLWEAGRVHPSVLAAQMGMTRGAISKLVERLCEKKLARRIEGTGDRRFHEVELTAAGKKLTPVLAGLADDNDREHFSHLSAAQRADLTRLLQELVVRHGWKDVPVQ